jgi:membrane protease YdiL (CAAX protease family)
MSNGNRLPQTRTFGQLLVPFALPYLLYTGLTEGLPSAIAPVWQQGIKGVAVAAALIVFRQSYRFGSFRPAHAAWILGAAPVALVLWVGPLLALRSLGIPWEVPAFGGKAGYALHLVNSVVLVSLFEELLMRVYLMEWSCQAWESRNGRTFIDALLVTQDAKPEDRLRLPIIPASVILTTTVFALGHAPIEYASALLYFLFTTWVYRRTGSLGVCIGIHAVTNLVLAVFRF